MTKFGVFFLLTAFSAVVFAAEKVKTKENSIFSDLQNNEAKKVQHLNYKFQKDEHPSLCPKKDVVSECYKNLVIDMHAKFKLSLHGMMATLPAGKGLIHNEKFNKQKANTKVSNSELSLESHKKQSEFAIMLINLSCTAATAKDWGVTDAELIKNDVVSSQNYLKTLRKVAVENIEQVRKYSNDESIVLQTKLDTTLLCEKK